MSSATRYRTAGRRPRCGRTGCSFVRWRLLTVADRSTPHPAATIEDPGSTRLRRSARACSRTAAEWSLRSRKVFGGEVALPAAGDRPPALGDQRRRMLAQPGSHPAARRDGRQRLGERLARARRLPALPAPLHPRHHDPVLAVGHIGRMRRDVLLDAAGGRPALRAPRSTRIGGHQHRPAAARQGISSCHSHARQREQGGRRIPILKHGPTVLA